MPRVLLGAPTRRRAIPGRSDGALDSPTGVAQRARRTTRENDGPLRRTGGNRDGGRFGPRAGDRAQASRARVPRSRASTSPPDAVNETADAITDGRWHRHGVPRRRLRPRLGAAPRSTAPRPTSAGRRSSSPARASAASSTATRCRSPIGSASSASTSPARCSPCQAALPHLLDGGGSIVTIASNAGLMGQPYSAAYCSSKAGVVNLSKALAVEYLKRKVRGELRRARRHRDAAAERVHGDARGRHLQGPARHHDADGQQHARGDRQHRRVRRVRRVPLHDRARSSPSTAASPRERATHVRRCRVRSGS